MLLNHIKHTHIYTHITKHFPEDTRITQSDATTNIDRITSLRIWMFISAAVLAPTTSIAILPCYYLLFYLALQPSAGYGLLVSRGFLITHNDAPQSVRLLWTSDQLVAETSTRQHITDIHPWARWDSNLRSQQASGRIPMPKTVRPLGPAILLCYIPKFNNA
jgi:hypothetical protein